MLSVITSSKIIDAVSMDYNEFVLVPREVDENNALYYYQINQGKLLIRNFFSIASGD